MEKILVAVAWPYASADIHQGNCIAGFRLVPEPARHGAVAGGVGGALVQLGRIAGCQVVGVVGEIDPAAAMGSSLSGEEFVPRLPGRRFEG